MLSSKILAIVTFVYLAATLVHIAGLIFKSRIMPQIGSIIVLGGFGAHTVSIILRWIESHKMGLGHAPFANFYESLVFFAWATVLIHFVARYRYKLIHAGAFTLPFAFFGLAYASFSPDITSRIEPLIPALRSNWLIAHVITCFIGYGAFAVSCGLSVAYLVRGTRENENLDMMNYRMIVFGFLFLTAGIATGSIWAHSAWGAYWQWDPKETWSLITWLIYATVLHARLRGWYGKKIALLSISGFISVLFTYFGVNFLMAGLHSYMN
ncbi:MAG: cytochrome c biogenesis protein [Pseudomonadota bacterium]